MWKEKNKDNPNTTKEKETHSLSLRVNSANTCVSSKFVKIKLDHSSHQYLCPPTNLPQGNLRRFFSYVCSILLCGAVKKLVSA